VVEFPWGHASDPVGVDPKPLEEFLTPSRVILPNHRNAVDTNGGRFCLARFAQRFRRTLDRASVIHPRLSSQRVVQVRTCAPFEGVSCSLEAFS